MLEVRAANGKRTIHKFEGIHRFELPDLNMHGGWVVRRLLGVYPALQEHTLASYLRGMVESNENLFLSQAHSVCLAAVERAHTTAPTPIVHVRFIFVEDPEDKGHVAEGGEFYSSVKQWAKHLGANIVLLGDASDVPLAQIKAKLGPTFEKTITYARV